MLILAEMMDFLSVDILAALESDAGGTLLCDGWLVWIPLK